MMRRMLILLSAIAGFAGPAFGAGQAFIGLHDEGSNGWGNRVSDLIKVHASQIIRRYFCMCMFKK